jgi:hypothetical protein
MATSPPIFTTDEGGRLMIWTLPHLLALALVWVPAPPPRPEHPRIREVFKELQRLRETLPNPEQSLNYTSLLRKLELLREYEREHRAEGPPAPPPPAPPLEQREWQRLLEERLQSIKKRFPHPERHPDYHRILQELERFTKGLLILSVGRIGNPSSSAGRITNPSYRNVRHPFVKRSR